MVSIANFTYSRIMSLTSSSWLFMARRQFKAASPGSPFATGDQLPADIPSCDFDNKHHVIKIIQLTSLSWHFKVEREWKAAATTSPRNLVMLLHSHQPIHVSTIQPTLQILPHSDPSLHPLPILPSTTSLILPNLLLSLPLHRSNRITLQPSQFTLFVLGLLLRPTTLLPLGFGNVARSGRARLKMALFGGRWRVAVCRGGGHFR